MQALRPERGRSEGRSRDKIWEVVMEEIVRRLKRGRC